MTDKIRALCYPFLRLREPAKRGGDDMEVHLQIKKYRVEMGLSQEELADKVFVTRQTISNWETQKSYPDIQSLLLLGTIFHISLDQLVKGDIEMMKQEIKKTEIDKLNRYSVILTILMLLLMVSAVPLVKVLDIYAIIPFGLLMVITFFVALKAEKVKKENHIHTYKEIVAFCEGKRLDEIQRIEEKAKRPYQNVLKALGAAVVTIVVCFLVEMILKLFL